jgi:hypothetical protein
VRVPDPGPPYNRNRALGALTLCWLALPSLLLSSRYTS